MLLNTTVGKDHLEQAVQANLIFPCSSRVSNFTALSLEGSHSRSMGLQWMKLGIRLPIVQLRSCLVTSDWYFFSMITLASLGLLSGHLARFFLAACRKIV